MPLTIQEAKGYPGVIFLDNETLHKPVLKEQVVDIFKEAKGYIVDCTCGYGGHSQAILEANQNVSLICNDQDQVAIDFSTKKLAKYKNRVTFTKQNFENIINTVKEKKIVGILADIGVSSLQLDDKSRGFSFLSQTLDMRMDRSNQLSAYDVVNHYTQTKLQQILKEYAEVKEAKKLSEAIVKNRPIKTAIELSKICEKYIYKKKTNPATGVFQAIRIEVNRELEVLENLLKTVEDADLKGCLVAIISFHSLEDRIVKRYFNSWSKNCICPTNFMRCECGNNNAKGYKITKKPIVATKDELAKNKRARSAKMRVFRFAS